RVSVGMRFVEDEWRVYEVEGGQAVRLDDANFLPGLLRSRNIGSEASVIGSLRVYNTALVTYSSTFPEIGFPDSLTVLGGEGGSPDHAGLVDTYLSSPPFEKSGYRFTYRRTGQDEYTITARSVESRSDSTRSFFTDQTGVIRFTTEDRDARSDDEPLQ
ncbi:MAG TPA: hypothetical protein VG897_12085, partial [Terriglobales bacterium]|nr:hypothetical protein [Terriglobales bacterium]